MSDLPKNFNYEYKAVHRYGWDHIWLVHGPHGSIHFHFTQHDDTEKYGPSAGLEIHHRTPPEYMADQAPHHPQCQVLHAPCWHDGTSLYATETLYPLVNLSAPLEFFHHIVGEMKRFDDESPE